ncbi:hypothetical protein GGR58DRAFT_469845 [Xylaria digitata]|nr:hypothetical protein GGR58DRAFT_469845 [Xylaria digitata]
MMSALRKNTNAASSTRACRKDALLQRFRSARCVIAISKLGSKYHSPRCSHSVDKVHG